MYNFTIQGAVPSKSNCYRIIRINNHGSLAKTKGLKVYEKMFFMQTPADLRGLMLDGLLRVQLNVYYPSMRSDIDNGAKIVLDCLQTAKVIKNDNLVTELYMTKHIDKTNPRAEITLSELI